MCVREKEAKLERDRVREKERVPRKGLTKCLVTTPKSISWKVSPNRVNGPRRADETRSKCRAKNTQINGTKAIGNKK